jgi:hypothetical protein
MWRSQDIRSYKRCKERYDNEMVENAESRDNPSPETAGSAKYFRRNFGGHE